MENMELTCICQCIDGEGPCRQHMDSEQQFLEEKEEALKNMIIMSMKRRNVWKL